MVEAPVVAIPEVKKEEQPATKLCSKCMMFYGPIAFNYLCSKCFKESGGVVASAAPPKQTTIYAHSDGTKPKDAEMKDETKPSIAVEE